MEKAQFFAKATGRRKTSVANLEVAPGSGTLLVNGRSLETRFAGYPDTIRSAKRPLCVSTFTSVDASAKIKGGGFQGQSGAFQTSLTRALVLLQPQTRSLFREYRFLTTDRRFKERRKYGLKKARKAPQFSKRLKYIFSLCLK